MIQCTDVGACKGTWGQHRYHQTICTGSWFWKKNPLPHRDLKPVSVLHLTFHNFSQTLYQLSCPHPHLVILNSTSTCLVWLQTYYQWYRKHSTGLTNIQSASSDLGVGHTDKQMDGWTDRLIIQSVYYPHHLLPTRDFVRRVKYWHPVSHTMSPQDDENV